MKKVVFYIISSLFLAGSWSCKKEERKVIFDGGTAPVLSSTVSSGSDIALSYSTQDDPAISFSWTNPEYQFNTGISSLDVNYDLEIDTAGSNFSNPKRALISTGTSLDYSFTQGELNSTLNVMKLPDSISHNLEIRISAFLVSQVGQPGLLYSNVLKYTATPYEIPPKVTPPASGTLYIVGSAVSYGWNNPLTNPAAQQFTRISNTDYQLTVPIIGDGEYKFISVNGLWDADKQWSIATEQASGDPSTLSYDLKANGANARAPLSGGNYLIDVDFQIGKVTLTKQ